MKDRTRLLLRIAAVAALFATSFPISAQGDDKTAQKTQLADGAGKKGAADKGDGKTEVPPPPGYRVGVEDEIAIAVWHEPELSQALVVRPDGMITLPLLNDVKVAGLTTEEVQALLTEKLKPFINDPQVTVIVKTVKSRKVSLVGNVVKQGVYPLNGHLTVLELLAEAGGLGPFAKSKSIYILRKQDGKEVRLPFNYKRAVSGKGDNPELMPGDMVVVP
ncbi:MAG TPA: polysaccharide biosynthesis/export family protein [Methylomirabilota bacterium]|nr:polysaccharide biosynthesis/export family protein [Methylomirabilota bacterium]